MPAKIPIHPGRIRQVPKQFNWIDGAWCVTATLTSAAIPLLPSICFLSLFQMLKV